MDTAWAGWALLLALNGFSKKQSVVCRHHMISLSSLSLFFPSSLSHSLPTQHIKLWKKTLANSHLLSTAYVLDVILRLQCCFIWFSWQSMERGLLCPLVGTNSYFKKCWVKRPKSHSPWEEALGLERLSSFPQIPALSTLPFQKKAEAKQKQKLWGGRSPFWARTRDENPFS